MIALDDIRTRMHAAADEAMFPSGLADRARRTARAARIRTAVTSAAAVIAVVVAVAVFATQAGNSTSAPDRPVPTDGRPGSPLPAHLVSPRGTIELGPVFSTPTWQMAALTVTGDAYAIMRNLAAQLAHAGFVADSDVPPCAVTSADLLECGTLADRPVSPATMQQVELDLVVSSTRTPFPDSLIVQSTLIPTGGSWPLPPAGSMFTVAPGPAPVEPLPADPPPSAATAFRTTSDGVDLSGRRPAPVETYTVVPGSHLLTTPMDDLECSNGLIAVLRIDGDRTDLARAADAYVQQFRSVGHLSVDPRSMPTWAVLGKGGSSFASVTQGSEGGVNYVLLRRCS